MHTPPEAIWLPAGPPSWESRRYPRGKLGDENIEAILQWLDFQVECHQGWLSLIDDPRHVPGEGSLGYQTPERVDRGHTVWDAYHLAYQLHKSRPQAPDPPRQPSRKYAHIKRDLEAVLVELREVRKWVAAAAKLEKGIAEGVSPLGQEQVVALIREHFPEIPRQELREMNPGDLAVYLQKVRNREELAPPQEEPPVGPEKKPPPPEPQTVRFTTTEAANYVNVHRNTMRRWLKEGKFDAVDVGNGRWAFPLAQLNAQRDAEKAEKS